VTENLNQWYAAGDQAYILVASAMVLVMIPGLAFLYSGLARRKSALSMIWACMFSASVITFQWYFWGYSLAFGPSTNGFIGNLDKFGLKGVLAAPSPGSPLIPELLYSFYQVRSTRTCSQHILTHARCNSALSLLPLSSVALLNAVA
jgi:Amt family ammonium transporter